jgi:hypothetical protein
MPNTEFFPNCCIGQVAYGFGSNCDDMRRVSPSDIEYLSRSIDTCGDSSPRGEFAVAALKKAQYRHNKKTFDAEGWVRVTQWMGGRIAIFVRRNGGARYAKHIKPRG